MPVARNKPMSREEFLAWEERQELRYEFDGVRVFAMPGGTRAHAAIQRNLAISVGGRLRGGPCEFFGDGLKVETRRGYRYPDGFVACTPGANSSTTVPDPVVLFEVLSPSTASVDSVTKNQEYAAIGSAKRYILLAQDRIGGTVFERTGDDWVGHVIAGDVVLSLPEIGIEIPLPELYDGVAVDEDAS